MSVPEQTPDIAPPTAHAQEGQVVLGVCDGRVIELRVVDATTPPGGFTARAARLFVRAGATVACRVYADGTAWTLAYRIARAEVATQEEAEVAVELVSATSLHEERRAPRAPHKALATAQAVYFRPYDLGALRVHLTTISSTSIAFESEKAFGVGQAYDLTLDDETGGRIEARVEVARIEAGFFGRTRVFTRIVAIDEPDRVRLDVLVSRATLRAEGAGVRQGLVRTLRAGTPAPPRRRSLSRIVRRA